MKPLLKAIMENDEPAVRQILLTDAPDLNKESFPSAIAFASELKRHSIARMLLVAGADPNHPMGAPIVLAAKNNDLEMAKLLASAGADLEIEDGAPLKEAERSNSKEVADFLRSRRSAFKPETMKTYRKLLQAFKDVQTLEGCCYRVKMHMHGGEVFLHQCRGEAGDYYDVQWWGKPEPFGFRIYPEHLSDAGLRERKVYGPYHFH